MTDQHMKESIKDHVLEQVLDAEKFKGFYLKPPDGGRMMSTLIIFHPEGITICGDLCPGLHGNCSAYGYSLGWFAGKLSGSYLCEKFLEKSWQRELAAQWCKDEAQEQRKEGNPEIADKLETLGSRDLECGDMDVRDFYERLTEISVGYVDDGVPGHGYDPGEKGWLCAIQEKFAELYNARTPAPAQ